MTGFSILHFLWAFGWSAILLVAYLGWGQLVLRVLRWPSPSIAISACVGIAVAIFVGGWLNLLHLITYGTLLAFTLAGVALALGFFVSRNSSTRSLEAGAIGQAWREPWPWKSVVLSCLILFFVFHAATTPVGRYMPSDDENFYLAMPVKIMQTHHFAADPFSERRIESSLGGSYFLQCLQVCCLPLKNVQMADHFVGLVLLVLLVLALAGQFELSPLLTALLAILCVLQVSEFNLTFTVVPSALWLAMVLTAAQEPASRLVAPALLVGLLAGAMCALKSTYLPFAAFFCAALYPLLAWDRGWKGALAVWLPALAGALVVMAPWMIAMRMTSGTFLYPVFGSGYDFSAYHQFPTPFAYNSHDIPWREIALALFIFAQLLLPLKKGGMIFLAATVACLLASLASAYITGGDDNPRYVWPILMPTLLVIFIHFAWQTRQPPAGRMEAVLLVPVVALLLVNATNDLIVRRHAVTMCQEIVAGLTDRDMDTAQTRQTYADIAVALPKDGSILLTLQHPYLLDFSRERFFLADFPGSAGPPDGWPIREDGEALSKFLLAHSIRYLAYTYSSTINCELGYCRFISGDLKHMSVRSQVQYGNYLLADRQYLELRQTRKTLYDDGQSFILDLATKTTP